MLVMEKEVEYTLNKERFHSPDIIQSMMREAFEIDKETEEYLYLLCFDTKMSLNGVFEISHGTINMSVASPREMFQKAFLCGAASMILVHNHPSGDCSPSEEDMGVFKKMKELGGVMGLPVLDSIIIGRGETPYCSLKEVLG